MFEAEGVVRGDTRLKCAPPLRGSQNRQQLWQALEQGTAEQHVESTALVGSAHRGRLKPSAGSRRLRPLQTSHGAGWLPSEGGGVASSPSSALDYAPPHGSARCTACFS